MNVVSQVVVAVATLSRQLIKLLLRPLSLLTLMLALSVSSLALANTAAGRVIMVKGQARAIDEQGQQRQLKRRDTVYTSDTITTAANSRLQIRFIDQGLMALKQNSTLTIKHYRQADNSDPDGKVLMRLVEGGFRTLTGTIGKGNKQAYKVETPVASIGIRGTLYSALLNDQGQLLAGVWKGGISLTSGQQSIDLGVDADFNFAAVSTNEVKGLLQAPEALASDQPGDKSANKTPSQQGSEAEQTNDEKQQNDINSDSDEVKAAEIKSQEIQDESEDAPSAIAATLASNTDKPEGSELESSDLVGTDDFEKAVGTALADGDTDGLSALGISDDDNSDGKNIISNEVAELDGKIPNPLDKLEDAGDLEQIEENLNRFNRNPLIDPDDNPFNIGSNDDPQSPDPRLSREEYQRFLQSSSLGAVVVNGIRTATLSFSSDEGSILFASPNDEQDLFSGIQIVRFDGEPEVIAHPLPGVSWGIWLGEEAQPVKVFSNPANNDFSSINGRVLWSSMQAIRQDELNELSGVVNYNFENGVGFNSNGDLLTSASGSFNLNFGNGDVSAGQLNAVFGNSDSWDVQFSGDISPALDDVSVPIVFFQINDIDHNGVDVTNLNTSEFSGVLTVPHEGATNPNFVGNFLLEDDNGERAEAFISAEPD